MLGHRVSNSDSLTETGLWVYQLIWRTLAACHHEGLNSAAEFLSVEPAEGKSQHVDRLRPLAAL